MARPWRRIRSWDPDCSRRHIRTHCATSSGRPLLFERQPLVGYTFKTIRIDRVFRPDVIVRNEVILELKCVEKLVHIHDAQLQTYLKITGLKTGLIFNFNTKFLRDGIRRIDVP